MRSEILWAARYGSLFATHQSTKQLNFVAAGCIWMSDFARAKVSVFSNLPIAFSEMVWCFIFPTSRDLHANTFRELSEVYADLIRHAGFHFPTTGNFTLWDWAPSLYILQFVAYLDTENNMISQNTSKWLLDMHVSMHTCHIKNNSTPKPWKSCWSESGWQPCILHSLLVINCLLFGKEMENKFWRPTIV